MKTAVGHRIANAHDYYNSRAFLRYNSFTDSVYQAVIFPSKFRKFSLFFESAEDKRTSVDFSRVKNALSCNIFTKFATFRKSHNNLFVPPPPQFLNNHCFQCLLGLTIVQKETENNDYAKFWGDKKIIMVFF